jgi:DNA-binding transcriptional LysR family regulator
MAAPVQTPVPPQTAQQHPDLLWSQVHTLTLLAQLGSFTRVAARAGLSKSAVSQRITELERSVGQTLVQRTTRSVRLTEAGQQLVDQTAEAYAQITRSVVEVRDLATQPRGLVRVTAPVALGRQCIGPHIESFIRANPGIRIELDVSDRLISLANEGFDLAIRHTSTPPDTHVAWKLCDSRSLLVATPAYLRQHGTPRQPEDLSAHACITYLRPGPAVWKLERGKSADPERVSVAVQGPLRASNSELVRDAALAGIGIALLPDFSAAAALRAGHLEEVLAPWRPVGFFGDAVHAIRPWGPRTPKSVQALVAHLREALKDGFKAETLR